MGTNQQIDLKKDFCGLDESSVFVYYIVLYKMDLVFYSVVVVLACLILLTNNLAAGTIDGKK